MRDMRIIAGEFRGRKLLPPDTDATRPITDRVKQSLFDIIAPSIPGAVIYDCFSGTGSMGLECLSRGAKQSVFFELDKNALKRLRENIQTLKVENHSTIISTDIFKYFNTQISIPKADFIFLDPPYRFLREKSADMQLLAKNMAAQLTDDGVVIFRHDATDNLPLEALKEIDRREYGSMTIVFLKKI